MTRLVVLAGPTAVGKGTLVRALRARHPDVWVSVSATTRQPRPTETDGEDYFFLTDDEFSHRVDDGEFLEWATVHGTHRYGTLRRPVEDRLRDSVPCVLEIDLQGARQVRQSMPEALFVFVKPPSWEELVSRLKGRGTESEEEQDRRLRTAREELEAESEFDEIVINDDLDEAVESLERLLGLSR